MTYPIEKLPKAMQEAIAGVSGLSGLPHEAVAGAALSMLSFAVQGHFDIQAQWGDNTGRVPASIYTVTVMESGGRKTSAFSYFNESWNKYLADEIDAYEVRHGNYLNELEVWEQERSRIKNDKSLIPTEKVKHLNHHDEVKPVCPPQPDSHFKAFTTAGLIDQLKSVRPSVGFFTSEAGELFKGYSGGSSNGGEVELAAALVNLWDGNSLKKATISGGRVLIQGRRAAACLMVQADVVKNFFNHRELAGQGIHGRLLVSRIPKVMNERADLSDEGKARTAGFRARLNAFNEVVYGWLCKELPVNPDDPYRLEPNFLEWENLSNSNPLVVWYNEVLNRHSDHTGASAFLNRQWENGHRIAGVLAAFKNEKQISDESADTAVALMEYYVDQRLGLYFGRADDRYSDLLEPSRYIEGFFAERKAAGKTTEFTMRELKQLARASVFSDLNADIQLKVMTGLEIGGVIERVKLKAGNGQEIQKYSYLL